MRIDRDDVRRWVVPAVVVLVVATVGVVWWASGRGPAGAGGGDPGPSAASGPDPAGPGAPGASDDDATRAVHRGGDLLLSRPGPLAGQVHDAEGTLLATVDGRTDGAVSVHIGEVNGTLAPDGTVVVDGVRVESGVPAFDGAALVAMTRTGPATRDGDHYLVARDGRPVEVWLGPSGRIVRIAGTDDDGVRTEVRVDEP